MKDEPSDDPKAGPDASGSAEAHPRRSRMVSGSPIYYGWFVVLAGTLTAMLTNPGQTNGVAVFLDHIIADLGLSRSGVSTLYLVGTLLGSLVLPFAGRFVDRRGPRTAVIVFAALFAAACAYMGIVFEAISLLIGFTLIRALGQGSLSLVALHVIAVWFVDKRGIAIGLMGVGTAISSAFFPVVLEAMIGAIGWRETYFVLAAVIAAVVIPVGALVYRDRPETYGLTPDGAAPPDRAEGGVTRTADTETESAVEIDYTLPEARRTITFWLFVAGLVFGSMLGTGLVFHHFSILAEGGVSRTDAALAFVWLGLASASANLATGALLRWVAPRFLLSAMLAALAGILVMAGFVSGPEVIIAYGLLMGLRTGMYASLQGNVFAYYFGRRHFGAIKGYVQAILIVGSAIGPLIMGAGYDLLGNYTATMIACAVPPAALAAVVPFLRLRRNGRVL